MKAGVVITSIVVLSGLLAAGQAIDRGLDGDGTGDKDSDPAASRCATGPGPVVSGQRAVRIAVAGDLVTAAPPGRPELSWVDHVAADGVSVEDTTVDPDARVRDLAAEARPSAADVLVVLAGSNDVAFATNNDDVELALQRLVDRTGVSRVLLASIPPGARQPQKTADFNDLLSRIAYRHDWSFVDASAALVARNCAYRPSMTLDGVRPSEAGAKAIARAVRGALTTRTDLDPE